MMWACFIPCRHSCLFRDCYADHIDAIKPSYCTHNATEISLHVACIQSLEARSIDDLPPTTEPVNNLELAKEVLKTHE